jgi:hypothetical protein
MTELATIQEHERAAARALEGLRAAAATLPPDHPSVAPLDEALAIAERHHRAVQEALNAAERAQTKAQHPDDYWSARWRT